jgi:ubiquitin-protein ligase
MVNFKLILIATLIASTAVGGIASISVYQPEMKYPEANVYPSDLVKIDDAMRDFRVVVSYHDDTIHEGTEFEVEVTDIETGLPVQGVNVSFISPKIHLSTNEEGVVYFSAPKIQNSETEFPLTVTKEGYTTSVKMIRVFKER